MGLEHTERESFEVFLMAAERERVRTKDRDRDYFSVRWEFVNTYLTHCEVDDPAQVLRDLVDLERALNR